MEDKLENNRLKYVEYTFGRYGIDPDSIEGQLIYYAYGHGYHQAEKDMELTWEDIPKIFSISEQLKTSWWFRDNEQTKLIGTQVFWEEVLKRFKETKKLTNLNSKTSRNWTIQMVCL